MCSKPKSNDKKIQVWKKKRYIFLNLSTELFKVCCMSLSPFKDFDNKAIFILFPLLIHCLKYPSQQNGLAFSAPQNLIRKFSLQKMSRTSLALLYKDQKFGIRGLGSRINRFVLFFAMLQRSLESFKPRRKFAIYFWYYHSVVCFLWKVTSALLFAFSQCLKGQCLHLLPSISGMAKGSPLNHLPNCF